MRLLSTAALLTATALVPAAFAQDNNENAAKDCENLAIFVQDTEQTDLGIDRGRALKIAAIGDVQACTDALQMARGDISADETSDNYNADAVARLRVLVPEPQVTVDQAAPQVEVEQRQPQVAVDPGQPTVTVTQAEPVVRVTTTPPKITIDMPKPEILVEMPDPEVDVALRKPRISVNQQAPEVSVEQGQVQIDMGEQKQAAATGEAEVDVNQKDASVSVDEAEQAEVMVSQTKPNVRYEAAEPRVEIEESGKPQISFNQSGEANVRFRQMTADETSAAAAESERQQTERTAAYEQTEADQAQQTAQTEAANDEPLSVVQSQPTDSQTGAAQRSFEATAILDMEVIGADGEEIGDVEELLFRDGETYAVIGSGGFLGLGEKEIALPLSDMRVSEDKLVMRAFTEDDVDQMQEFERSEFTPYDNNRPVNMGTE